MIPCSTRCYLSRAKMDGTVIWSIPASSMLTLCSWIERTKTAMLLEILYYVVGNLGNSMASINMPRVSLLD